MATNEKGDGALPPQTPDPSGDGGDLTAPDHSSASVANQEGPPVADDSLTVEPVGHSDGSKDDRFLDPFPDICPALLSAVDIKKYIDEVHLLDPQDLGDFKEEEKFKPAAVALRLRGRCLLYEYDDAGRKIKTYKQDLLKKGDVFVLRRNSIAYVSVAPMLRLPAYIVARFNLKIDYVYKGLLLGTGPMVDPGFEGYLSFPLHNLTNNEYRLAFNERIIWMEFTKVSPPLGVQTRNDRRDYGALKDVVRKYKAGVSVEDRIAKATAGGHVLSSLPGMFQSIEKKAKLAERRAQFAQWTTFISAVGVLIAVLGVAYNVHDSASAHVRESAAELRQVRGAGQVYDASIERLRQDAELRSEQLARQEEEVKRLAGR